MMESKIKAQELVDRMLLDHDMPYDLSKECALIAVDELIKYHESLYNEGFKDVHIALSSPIKTYNDILNPLLKYWKEVKQEIELL
jgi:hypothetical protein